MRQLTNEQLEAMHRSRNELLKDVDLDSIKPMLLFSGTHRAAFIAGLEHAQRTGAGQQAANAELVGVLLELVDLMQGVIDDNYTPDGFTLQPARRALARVGELKNDNL